MKWRDLGYNKGRSSSKDTFRPLDFASLRAFTFFRDRWKGLEYSRPQTRRHQQLHPEELPTLILTLEIYLMIRSKLAKIVTPTEFDAPSANFRIAL